MDEKELDDILANHKKWLNGEGGGKRADLHYADLSGADLSCAHLSCAKNIPPLVEAVTSILPAGEIVGWKMAHGALVKLSIPADARRSNATGRKCRCDKAVVLGITKDGKEAESAISNHDESFVYRVGDTVVPDSFDENRWEECSNGIHFFITKEEAIEYAG